MLDHLSEQIQQHEQASFLSLVCIVSGHVLKPDEAFGHIYENQRG